MSEDRNSLPTGWAVVPVQELFDIVGGGTPSTAVPEYWQGQIDWITSADIDDRHKITPRRTISEQAIENSATNLVPTGSVVVVTRVGLGKVGIAERPLCFSQDSQALILPSEPLHPRYVLFYMGTAVSVFKYTGRGTTISGVTKKQLANLEFRLPPLSEQRRIVAEIEKQFTRLEVAVAALKRVQANLKRYRAAVLKAAVEGRLVPTEAELARAEARSYEPADQLLQRILAERRARWQADQLAKFRASGKEPKDDEWKARYEEPAGPETAGLPRLPEGWIWCSLGAVAEVKLGKMLSPKAYETGLIQMSYLRNENVRWGSIDFTDVKKMGFRPHELERYALKPNDLLVCEGGEAGRCAVYPGQDGTHMFQKALHRVRPHAGLVSPSLIQFWLWHYVTSKTVIPRPSETTIQHLPLEEMQKLPLMLPPASEQVRVVAEVERRFSGIHELEMQVAANLKRAERLRQAVLKRAFEGKLVSQDPDDEPASVLLARIRAERARSAATPGCAQKKSTRRSRAAKSGCAT